MKSSNNNNRGVGLEEIYCTVSKHVLREAYMILPILVVISPSRLKVSTDRLLSKIESSSEDA